MEEGYELTRQIAEEIENHRQLETKFLQRPDKNLAVGLSHVHYFGKAHRIWLTTRENLGGYRRVDNITGHIHGTVAEGPTTITDDGLVVNKNSKVGEIIIRNVHSTGEIQTPKGLKKIRVLNLSSFVPNPHKPEATDLVIEIDQSKPRRYSTLSELLEIFKKAEESIQKLEQEEQELTERLDPAFKEKEEQELDRIAREKAEAKRAREFALSKARSFIRKSAELRYQPILDPRQEEIKRARIYNGTLAIDGGPGTGKTTALIQRIKFLLDQEAMLGSRDEREDMSGEGYLPDMSETQRKVLFENERNWVFFTPNELLKLFLRNNMIQEGLQADDRRVKVWRDYLSKLIKDYELVKTDTQNPFLFLRKRLNENLLPRKGAKVKKLLNGFEKHLLAILNSRLEKITVLDVSPFGWKTKGASIQNYIKRQEKDYSLEGLIRLYFNLQETYSDEVSELRNKFNELLAKSAARIEIEVRNNESLEKQIVEFAEQWRASSNLNEEVEVEEEDEELEDNTGDLNGFLFGKYKLLIKNSALSEYDPSVKLSKKYQEFNEIIGEYLNIREFDSFNQIGQLAYFVKYFVTCTKGIVRNVFSAIPRAYKSFRKNQLVAKNKNWNLDLLQYIVVEDKSRNKRLHPEEQAFLIFYLNRAVEKAHKVSKRKSREISQAYFEAFRNHSVPVIAVDEATDFHVVELMAMHSLSHMEISSVTFSGDLMQRLTSGGITDWNELNGLIRNLEVKGLQVSYRQSPTLLGVANFIYQKATKKKAEYTSYLEKDDSEPKPLLFRSNSEEAKVEWIGGRILEIYQAYGRQFIPSIAIFLPSDNGIEEFAEYLGEMDELADVGIKVRASKDGQVLGDKNTVRIFPVEYIKGMEFEAVFFHNMHLIQESFKSEEMVMKHLYVGLSRASFYMGVTTGMNQGFDYLDNHFLSNSPSWS